MTGPLEFVERMHRDAEWLARDCHGGKRWTAREGQIVRDDGKVIAECPLNAHARLTASVLLALVGSPDAVLRRVAAERKLLALRHPNEHYPDDCYDCRREPGWQYGTPADRPCVRVRALAEGWGWEDGPGER